jgi:hypothetical protein
VPHSQLDMTAPLPADEITSRLAALQQEIEQVHQEVHELADEVADLRRAWNMLPGWLRWLARAPRL